MACIENNSTECENYSVYTCQVGSVEYYGYIYFHTPMAISGVVLNVLNLKLLLGAPFKNYGPTFTFLAHKAVGDFFFLILASPIGIVRCANQSQDWQLFSRQVYDIFIYTPIGHTFSTVSVWMTAIVSIERYITMAHSTATSRKICTKERANWGILFIYVFAVMINFPYFFYRCLSDDNTRTYTSFAYSNGFNVYTWMRTVLIKYIPILVVTVFNMMILGYICYNTKKRRTSVFPGPANHTIEKIQTRVTSMLLGMTITFVICHCLEPFIHAGIYRYGLLYFCGVEGRIKKEICTKVS